MILLKKLSIIDDEPYIIPIDQGMVEMNFNNFICVVKEDKVSIKNRNTDEIYLFDWNDLDLCVNTILNLEKKE